MAVEIGVIKTNGPTGGATVDHEIAGFGTPTAAIVLWNKTANPGSTAKEQTIGFYDGTRTRSMGIDALSGAGTTDTWRASHESEIVPNTHYGAGRATVSGWSTNGITIVWDSMAVAWDVTIILFKGTTNVRVDTASMSLAGTTITAPGFQPDLVFTLNNGAVVPWGGYQPHAIMSMGVTHNSSTGINQGMIAISSPDAYSTNENVSITRDNASFNQIFGAEAYYGYLDNFSANGFDVTTSADSGTDELIYLAIELPDQDDAFVGTLSTPTTATTKSMTGFGFEPVGVGVLASHNPTINTLNSTTSGSLGFGFSYHNGTGFIESVQGYSIEDTTGTSNVSDIAEAKVINLQTHTDTLSHVANIDSFDSDGVTFDFTTTEGTALDMVVWGVGDSTATGSDGNAAGVLSDISVSSVLATAQGVAYATTVLDDIILSSVNVIVEGQSTALTAPNDVGTSNIDATSSGSSNSSTTIDDITVISVDGNATTASGITASGLISNTSISSVYSIATGSSNISVFVSDTSVSNTDASAGNPAYAATSISNIYLISMEGSVSASSNTSTSVNDISVSYITGYGQGSSNASVSIDDILVNPIDATTYVGFISRDIIQFELTLTQEHIIDANITEVHGISSNIVQAHKVEVEL